MGKVKVKIIGDESLEQEALDEQKKKREQKKAEKAKVKGVGLGGGQRIQSIGVSEEELMAEETKPEEEKEETSKDEQDQKQEKKTKSRKNAPRARSKRHNENKLKIGNGTLYPIKNGIEILKTFKTGKFDETVELHINVKEKNVSGQVVLPHGTGKELRIKVADDVLVSEIEKGKINFDILIAEPSMMPKLARVAKILGPRGLMPNPKAGTITDKPDEAAKKFSAGQISFKTETGGPIIHMRIGKVSLKDSALEENIKTVLTAIGAPKISSVTLKSTMSPGIKLQI